MTIAPSAAPVITISQLPAHAGQQATLRGWVQNRRDSKGLVFLVLRDGSGFAQCVVSEDALGPALFDAVKRLGLESSVQLTGEVRQDERQIGGFELHASAVKIFHDAENYPIGKKEHGVDFLLQQRHLWLRSRRQWAIMRVRNRIIWAIHSHFQRQGFIQMDAPIFTGNACEGTSTLFETDFFGAPAYLSQSGQLYGEAMAMAMGKIYTFGPTFRAEKSKTRRHLSEFWMIEPEMAWHTLEDTLDIIEGFLRDVVLDVVEHCKDELEILERDTAKLTTVAQPFIRLPYHQAVSIIKGEELVDGRSAPDTMQADLDATIERIKAIEIEIAEREKSLSAGGMKKGQVSFNEEKVRTLKLELKEQEEAARNLPNWIASARNFERGDDFGGSDETVLTRMFDRPIMVYHWPKAIKAFYMKETETDPTLVKGVDVLAPEGYGEIVGGGERETDIGTLIDAIQKHELPMDAFEWYLDLRRYGSVPHSGFGLGLERLVCWICKLPHVRESIPFPRYLGNILP